MAKARYSKPNSQLDLEERQKNGNASDRVLSTADVYDGPEVEGDKPGYVGVDPMYQNAASASNAPGVSKDGPEAKVFEQFTGEKQEDVEPEGDDFGDEEEDEEESSSGSTSSTGGTGSSS